MLALLAAAAAAAAGGASAACQWRLPFDAAAVPGQQAALSAVDTPLGPMAHRQVSLAANTTLAPELKAHSDLLCPNSTGTFRVVASASMFAGAGWWLNGGAWIYGRLNATHSFLYWQRVDQLGELFEAAPIPTLSQIILPTAAPLPGHGAGSVGFVPPPLGRSWTTRSEIAVGDALLLAVASPNPGTPAEKAAEMVSMLHAVLPTITPPSTTLPAGEWMAVAEAALAALEDAATNRTRLDWRGKRWLRSYVNDYRTTPELLTHVDVVEALVRYELATGKRTQLGSDMRSNMATGVFFNEQLRVLMDWAGTGVIGAGSQGDTWYTLFVHIKFAHLALLGETWAEDQLLKSIDFVIMLGRKMQYRFPTFFRYVGQERVYGGAEHSDAMGYAYLMLQMHELRPDNRTFLAEARAAYQEGQGRSLFNGSFDGLMYERPFPSLGCVALAKLANITAKPSLYDEALRAAASMLQWITPYQVAHGYRGAVPSFMALSAMASSYSAAFETHQSLRYLTECLELSKGHWPTEAVQLFSAVTKHASGVARSAYPDVLPAYALSGVGCPTVFMGNIDCMLHSTNASGNGWLNDRSVMVPVEDLVWESHRAEADQHGALPECGQVGQEIYGAGLAFDMALLQDDYGAASSMVPSVGSATLVPFPRLLRTSAASTGAGGNLSRSSGSYSVQFALQGAAESVLESVLMELEAPAGITLKHLPRRALLATGGSCDHSHSAISEVRAEGRDHRTVALSVGAGVTAGAKEMLLWLQPQCEPWRAFRMVLIVS